MTDKLLNIEEIPADSELKKVIEIINENVKRINNNIGIQPQVTEFTISPEKWEDGTMEQIRDVNKPDATKINLAREVAYRAFVEVKVPHPKKRGVNYTDVWITPKYTDTSAAITSLKSITSSGVLLLDHTKLEDLNKRDANEDPTPLYLMFAALSSKPLETLTYELTLL